MSSSAVELDGGMGELLSLEPTRRHLSVRQARTVQKLTEAALEELRSVGFDGLTVRNVARRAGTAPATAYTYFTSKEHLVTEVFWRRLQGLAPTELADDMTPDARVSATLADLALMVVDEPELAAACTVAMLAPEPDVKLLRDQIGAEVSRRVGRALGDVADPAVKATLELVVTGALLQAGMGHVAYEDLPELLAAAAKVVLRP